MSGATRAVGALVERLRDADWQVRVAAITSLGVIGDAEAIQPIAGAVKEADRLPGFDAAAAIRAAAVGAFRRIALQNPPPIVEAARDKHPKVREVAVEALGGVEHEDAHAQLLAALADDRSGVRQAATRGLIRIAGPRGVDGLVTALQHKDAATRRCAAEALGAMRDERATSALAAAATDRDQGVRDAAVQALAQADTASATRALVALAGAPDRALRQAAMTALASASWSPVDARERALQAILRGDWATAVREGDAAIDPLVAALGDRDVAIRRGAAEGLALARHARAAAALVEALADHDDKVRGGAVRALVAIGPPALEPLARRLEARAGTVRTAAGEVLRGLGEVPGVLSAHVAALSAGRPVARGPNAFVEITGQAAADHLRRALDGARSLLEQVPDHLPTSEVQAAATLPDVITVEDLPGSDRAPGQRVEEVIDLSELRDLAARVLSRR
jgi:HEAT repeat protein